MASSAQSFEKIANVQEKEIRQQKTRALGRGSNQSIVSEHDDVDVEQGDIEKGGVEMINMNAMRADSMAEEPLARLL